MISEATLATQARYPARAYQPTPVCAAVLLSPTSMTMTTILSVLLAQLTWNLAAAVLRIRKPGA